MFKKIFRLKGRSLEVNPVGDNELRNIARIERIKQSLERLRKKDLVDTEQYRSFQRELIRRGGSDA